MTTATTVLTADERFSWGYNAETLLPANPAFFWSQVYDLAIRKAGHTPYRGAKWTARVVAIAESVLTELGIEWEIYAGNRYIVGKRVYWNQIKVRWEQDDYR